MQLAPGERSILSYFPSSEKAQEAARALKEAGVNEVRVDRVSRYGTTFDDNFNNPLNHAATITGVTLYSGGAGDLNDAARVLLGADPSVSGYGMENYGTAGQRAFLVTAVTGEEHLDRAVEIIKQHGGEV
ncbi:MAG: hypothetical protein HPY89_08865 [Pelotomaculum sp.]|nr:hypothetical protein [Pelotomaculum sp.]